MATSVRRNALPGKAVAGVAVPDQSSAAGKIPRWHSDFPHHDTEIPETCLFPRHRVQIDPERPNPGCAQAVRSQQARSFGANAPAGCGPESNSSPCRFGKTRAATGRTPARSHQVRWVFRHAGKNRRAPGRAAQSRSDRPCQVRRQSSEVAEHRPARCGQGSSDQGSRRDHPAQDQGNADADRARSRKVPGAQTEDKVRSAAPIACDGHHSEKTSGEASVRKGRFHNERAAEKNALDSESCRCGDQACRPACPAHHGSRPPLKGCESAPAGRIQAEASDGNRQADRAKASGSGSRCGSQAPPGAHRGRATTDSTRKNGRIRCPQSRGSEISASTPGAGRGFGGFQARPQ